MGTVSFGGLIGIASLLRAEACEEVSAASPIDALLIKDTLVADIYKNDPGFREWCNTTIFPAEISSLLEALIYKSEKSPYCVTDLLAETLSKAEIYQEENITSKNSQQHELVFLGSNNCSADLNSIVENKQFLGQARGTFDIRLIKLPAEHVEKIQRGKDINQLEESSDIDSIVGEEKNNFTIPERTILDLDGKNPKEEITLIRGNGPMEESLACFKMVAQIMNLPYRKDVIEKSVRETINRGRSLVCQCLDNWLREWDYLHPVRLLTHL